MGAAGRFDNSELDFAVINAKEASDSTLRSDLLRTWVDVTNAGGAVGFTAPADPSAIAQTLDAALARAASGRDALGILRTPQGAVGLGFLVQNGSALMQHWRTVLRLMVHPDLQGTGAGRVLLEGLHRTARELGLEHLRLTVRGGTGIEGFYERFGYTVVGRHPRAIRLAPGDDRDELIMVVRL